MEELEEYIKKAKKRKAPGPDGIPMEFYKAMNFEMKYEILTILNHWWNEEDIPEEALKARVVLLYKKGATSDIENYRPISLLNSMVKIFAAILKKRSQRKWTTNYKTRNTDSERRKALITPYT